MNAVERRNEAPLTRPSAQVTAQRRSDNDVPTQCRGGHQNGVKLVDKSKSGPFRAVQWILDVLYAVVFAAAIVGIVVVVAVVSWQVFSRYVTSTSAAWAPELAQVAFVWAALLAIAVGVRQGKHMVVDAYSSVRSRVLNVALNTLTAAAIVAVSVTLVWFGYDSLSVSFRRTFPALGIATGWMHLAIPVGFGFCALFALEAWFKSLFNLRHQTDTLGHSEMIDGMDESSHSGTEGQVH